MAEPALKDEAPDVEQSDEAKVAQLPTPPRRRRRWIRSLLRFKLMLVLPALALLYGAVLWAESLRYVTTENAYVKSNVVAVSADVSGRVIDIGVKDNQTVAQGAVLFRIDPRPFQLEVDSKLAELGAVRQDVEAKRAAYRAGQRQIEESRETVHFMEREYKRANALANRGVSTAAKLDEARYGLDMARRRLVTAEESNRTILAELGGDLKRSVEDHPDYLKLVADFDLAQLDLDRTTVLAPADGIVSNVKLRLGEYVRAGTPVFSMVETGDVWIEANLKETQLTHIVVGQKAALTADAFPDESFDARIESISPATGAEFALLPPQNASGNWVKVVQRVPVRLRIDAKADQPMLRAGMTISVSIDTRRERSLRRVMFDNLTGTVADDYLPATVMAWLENG
ncbi:MAG: HlyD family secretion protein [Alphaproteobacteria bacterium]|nr:HlyD family secretion protein [Alphaproteobacteria bacterium]